MNNLIQGTVINVGKYPEDTTRFQLPSYGDLSTWAGKESNKIARAILAEDEPMDFKVSKKKQHDVAHALRSHGFKVATGVGIFKNKITVFPKGEY